MLNDPRYDFARGVRELAATTASLMDAPASGGRAALGAPGGEAPAALGQILQQRRRSPQFSMRLFELTDAGVDIFQADAVRIPHGAAAISREAVAGNVNDVEVGGAESD